MCCFYLKLRVSETLDASCATAPPSGRYVVSCVLACWGLHCISTREGVSFMCRFCSSPLACTFFSQHLIYQPQASCCNEPTPDVLGLKAERMCFSFVDQTEARVSPMGWGLCFTQALQESPRELHCCGWVWVSLADLPRSPHGRSWGRGHGAGRHAVPLRTLGTLWWWANRADKERRKHTLAVAFGPSYLSEKPPSFCKGANSPSNGAMRSERKPPFPGNMRHGAPTQHRRLSTA